MARSKTIFYFEDRLGLHMDLRSSTVLAAFTVKHEAMTFGRNHYDPNAVGLYRIPDGRGAGERVEVEDWNDLRQ